MSSVFNPGVTAGQPAPMREGEFGPQTIPNVVTFKEQDVTPPSQVYIRRDDVLFIVATSSIATENIVVNYKLLLADGHVAIGQETFVIPFTYAASSFSIPLAEGFLLSVSVGVNDATMRGQTFCSVGLIRGPLTLLNQPQVLIADYLISFAPASWPGARLITPQEGPGRTRTITIANPAPGADWTRAAEANTLWRPLGITGLLTTAVAVATRDVSYIISIGGVNVMVAASQSTQAASLAVTYVLYPGATSQVVNAANIVQLSGYQGAGVLQATISSVTNNIQGADQWSAIRLTVEEWVIG